MQCGAGQHKLKVYATNGRYIIRNGITVCTTMTLTVAQTVNSQGRIVLNVLLCTFHPRIDAEYAYGFRVPSVRKLSSAFSGCPIGLYAFHLQIHIHECEP